MSHASHKQSARQKSSRSTTLRIGRWSELKRRRLSEARIAQIKEQVSQEIIEMNLKALREVVGLTQEEVAERMGALQPEVSRAEKREDHRVSTLRQYVEALGGEVEVVARFGDKSVRLRGV